MIDKALEQKAQDMADGLGISFYVSPRGQITQKNEDGLSKEIRPRDGAKPIPFDLPEVEMLKDAITTDKPT